MELQRTPTNSEELWGALRYPEELRSGELFKNSRSLQDLQGTLSVYFDLLEPLGNILELQTTLKNFEELLETFKNSRELWGTPRNFKKLEGTPKNSKEFQRTQWNSEELQVNLRNSEEGNLISHNWINTMKKKFSYYWYLTL